MWKWSGILPSAAALPSIVALLLGGLVGWLLHPLVWWFGGPFRWSAYLLACASQESGYSATAYNDENGHENGGSAGILQFQEATWIALTGRSLDDRSNCFLQGFYAARYVQLALMTDWRWWSCILPVWGFGVLRVMWGHGIASSSAERQLELAPQKLSPSYESRAFPAWIVWRSFSLIPAGLVAAALARVRLGRRR